MLADSTKKLFTVLLCHKLDRFARDAYSYAVNKRLLNKQGVTIEYAAQHFDASPEGVLMESIIAGFAEYYSSNLAKETRKGLDQNARSGKSCGGKLPLGYLRTEAGLIEVDESTATIIRGIFKDKETMSCEAVAKKYRKPISTIKTILHNKKYRGIGVFGLRSKISGAPTVEFSFPAIIEEELA
jgi:site-specific DNA recombinase